MRINLYFPNDLSVLLHMLQLLVCIFLPTNVSTQNIPTRPNILFMVSDDMRPNLNVYHPEGLTQAPITPNIDKLAQNGIFFSRAYTQYAFCSPSRNSFMVGRRPDTTKVWNFINDFRQEGNLSWTTIPQAFKNNGYITTGMGKLFHPGHPPKNDLPYSWTQKWNGTDVSYWEGASQLDCCHDAQKQAHMYCDMQANKTIDYQLADLAISRLEFLNQKQSEAPFFLGIGFRKPHVYWCYPIEIQNLYPPVDQIDVPVKEARTAPKDMPYIAYTGSPVFGHTAPDWHDYKQRPDSPIPLDSLRAARRGYYGAITWVDRQVGRVLDALDNFGLTNSTIVVFTADHGFQLGEHAEFEKYTAFELATRVPLIVSVPWITPDDKKGSRSDALVELVDIEPTLVDLANLNNRSGLTTLEGTSFKPLLAHPNQKWKNATFSQHARSWKGDPNVLPDHCPNVARNNITHMGYTIRSKDWRYTEWLIWNGTTLKPNWGKNIGIELYDHRNDACQISDFNSFENSNVANQPQYADIVTELSAALRAGWRNALPP